MSKLTDFRAQHPEYNDMSDMDLGTALHRRFYSDMPKADFDSMIGLQGQPGGSARTPEMLTQLGGGATDARQEPYQPPMQLRYMPGTAGAEGQGPPPVVAPPPAPAPAPPSIPLAAPGAPSLPGFTPLQAAETPTGEFQVQQPTPGGAMTAPDTSTPAGTSDVALSGASGIARGFIGLPGIPGNLEYLARRGSQLGGYYAGGNAPNGEFQGAAPTPRGPLPPPPSTVVPTSADVIRAFEENVAPITHTPQTTAGRISQAIGEFAPGALFGPAAQSTVGGQIVTRLGLNVAAPALASEAAGHVLAGTPAEPFGRVAAALAAPWAATRITTPLPAGAHHMAAADALAAEGVNLTAGQRTERLPLLYAESMAHETPFAGARAANMLEQQGQQFTRAVLRRIGADADRATPDVMEAARLRISAEFDRVTQNPLPLNAVTRGQLATRLGDAFRRYLELVPETAQRPFVEGFLNDVLNAMAPPGGRMPRQIPGDTIQSWRSRLSRMAADSQDPEFAAFLRAARETLDDIYGAHLPPGEAAAWATARQQWGALIELQQALARTGQQAASGIITPSALGNADINANARAYVEGTGRFSDLASAGMQTMTPPRNSGTPGRLMAMGVMGALGSTGGHLMGYGEPIGPALMSSVVGPSIGARALMSRPVQGYLGNQVMPRMGARPTIPSSVADALLATQGAQPATLGGR